MDVTQTTKTKDQVIMKVPLPYAKPLLLVDPKDCDVHPSNNRTFDEEHKEAIKESMRSKGVDSNSPILAVKGDDGRWKVLAGKHRLAAATELGLQLFLSDESNLSELEQHYEIPRSNISKKFSMLDHARHYVLMKEKFPEAKLSQTEYARQMGINQPMLSTAVKALPLLDIEEIAEDVQHVEMCSLLQIARAPNQQDQIELVKQTREGNLSVRQLHDMVNKMIQRQEFQNAPDNPDGSAPPEPTENIFFRVPLSIGAVIRQATDLAGETSEYVASYGGDSGIALGFICQYFIEQVRDGALDNYE